MIKKEKSFDERELLFVFWPESIKKTLYLNKRRFNLKYSFYFVVFLIVEICNTKENF